MKKLITCLLIPPVIFWVSCTGQKGIGKEYVLNDLPMRNLHLTFNKDSSYKLINQKEGSVFSSSGKWQLIDKRSYLMINPYRLENKCDTVNRAMKEGEQINYDQMRELGSSYLFPAIMMDTVRFSKNYRSLTLKGYKFGR
ncbi:MAG: hypothetical protein JNL51_18350 [Chitinophagaceae bacterium]|nr:hypothetical protein [Chitinophagaceae bacterium]